MAALFAFFERQGSTLSTFLAAATPLAWLLPSHYPPWLSAWQDGVALALLFAGATAARQRATLPLLWVVAIAVAAASVTLQWATGRILFGGDALMVLLYVGAFILSIALGSTLPKPLSGSRSWALDVMAVVTVLSAVVSVGIAVAQWTGSLNLGIWGVDMPPGGRPYGNVAQPNHLCTISFIGLCSLALLHERRRIGNTGLSIGAIWLVLGMVMTGSRTGWLQMVGLGVMGVGLYRRSGLQIGALPALAVAVIYVVSVCVWPAINESLSLSPGRVADDVSSGGTRPLHWAAMLTAIGQEPWFGYGWQQVSVAQVRTANLQPFVGEHIEHSHNLFFDLLIWNGLPIGLLLCGILVWWFGSQLVRCRDATVFWLLACISGLAAHAMVEYPLSFAYFLIPMGVWIGAVDTLQGVRKAWVIPIRSIQISSVLFAGVLGWVAVDYVKAEQAYRLLRLESARIGARGLTTPPPELQVLTQLEAFQRFAHTEARTGMSPAQLEFMRKVSERYAYPPSMFRYALAQGLNGNPDGAALTLLRLCRIHPRARCDEGREAWVGLQQRYVGLQNIQYPGQQAIDALN